MIINVDLDCTLNNLVDVWCATLNKIYGTNVLSDDITDYKIQKFFPTLSEEQIYKPLYSENFWIGMSPLYHSQKCLKKLYEDKHDINIVTATHYTNAKVKVEWIQKHFPFIHWKKINIIHDKSRFSGDLLIDDCFDNLIGFTGEKLLYTQPWNNKYTVSDIQSLGITRVNSWDEIYELIPKPYPCGKNKKAFDFECLNCDLNCYKII